MNSVVALKQSSFLAKEIALEGAGKALNRREGLWQNVKSLVKLLTFCHRGPVAER